MKSLSRTDTTGMIDTEAAIIETELGPPFSIVGHDSQSTPFIFNSPHSGRVYPRSFIAASRLTQRALRKSEDAFVDELFAFAPDLGAVLMHAHFPRCYLDVNREPYELDPLLIAGRLPDYANTHSVRVIGGLGTIARIVNEQEEIYRQPLPLAAALMRINRLHRPYHHALRDLVERTRARFGVAFLIDCHSMPSHPGAQDGSPVPDFVLGDRFGSSCRRDLVSFAEARLKDWGFRVVLNKPYSGGYITEAYGQPARNVHALQIEVNRALYMDEANFVKSGSFDTISHKLRELARSMIEHAGQLAGAYPRAAE
jgi:N-formylglutamate amidohydrolase